MSNAVTVKYAIKFKEAMVEGLNGIIRAAQIYVALIDQHPDLEDSFKQECKGFIPDGIWGKMEKVGRGHLHPRLMLGSFNSLAKSHAVSRLPIELQEAAIHGERFDMVIDGQPVKASIEEAPAEAVNRMCASGGPRKIEQQIELAKAEKETSKTIESGFSIIDGGRHVLFKRNTTMNKKQLLALAKGMVE